MYNNSKNTFSNKFEKLLEKNIFTRFGYPKQEDEQPVAKRVFKRI